MRIRNDGEKAVGGNMVAVQCPTSAKQPMETRGSTALIGSPVIAQPYACESIIVVTSSSALQHPVKYQFN